ncbi:hypothetical protein [Prosthecochloris marina]|uniref:hypothetical protein n=1 Tax=Prosthecochloris marina TaxID=2017681 RepID=UPI0012947701|nr:hypothetical protein [Prosthecochloris marina]
MDPRVKPEDDRERNVMVRLVWRPVLSKSCRTRCGVQLLQSHAALDAASIG